MEHAPLTEDQAKQIRSMSLYWDELRHRDNPGDGFQQEAMHVMSLVGAHGILRLAEFAANAMDA